MPACRHCSHEVGYDAKFCPQCGTRDPAENWSTRGDTPSDKNVFNLLPWSEETTYNACGAIGGIIGFIFACSLGFKMGGLGGSILFGLIGAGLGFVAGFMGAIILGFAANLALIIGTIGLVIWLLAHLWGIGK